MSSGSGLAGQAFSGFKEPSCLAVPSLVKQVTFAAFLALSLAKQTRIMLLTNQQLCKNEHGQRHLNRSKLGQVRQKQLGIYTSLSLSLLALFMRSAESATSVLNGFFIPNVIPNTRPPFFPPRPPLPFPLVLALSLLCGAAPACNLTQVGGGDTHCQDGPRVSWTAIQCPRPTRHPRGGWCREVDTRSVELV